MMNEEIPKEIIKSIEQIRMDNISSSVDLAKKSADVIIKLIEITDSFNHIKKTANKLIEAQPAMASIFNLVNNLMYIIDEKKDQLCKNIIQSYCNKFLEELKVSDELIAKHSNQLINNNSTIITHSSSSTVLNTLLYANKEKKFRVICTESRPKNEGIRLAKNLGENAIKVNLVVDSAVFSFIPQADIIFIGGDAITKNSLINKIGTNGLAIVADKHKIPIYALCSSIKFLPYDYKINFYIQKNPYELLNENISNVTPINFYFDTTPLKHLTGIISEEGIFNLSELEEKVKHKKIHNILK